MTRDNTYSCYALVEAFVCIYGVDYFGPLQDFHGQPQERPFAAMIAPRSSSKHIFHDVVQLQQKHDRVENYQS